MWSIDSLKSMAKNVVNAYLIMPVLFLKGSLQYFFKPVTRAGRTAADQGCVYVILKSSRYEFIFTVTKSLDIGD